jgi:hypothetical protein
MGLTKADQQFISLPAWPSLHFLLDHICADVSSRAACSSGRIRARLHAQPALGFLLCATCSCFHGRADAAAAARLVQPCGRQAPGSSPARLRRLRTGLHNRGSCGRFHFLRHCGASASASLRRQREQLQSWRSGASHFRASCVLTCPRPRARVERHNRILVALLLPKHTFACPASRRRCTPTCSSALCV